MHSTINETLLANYLAGQATEQELKALDAWLAAETSHTLELDQYRKLWETRRQSAHFEPDTNMAWQNVHSRINQPLPLAVPKKNIFANYMSIAASLALLLGIGWLLYFFNNKPTVYQTIVSENTSKQHSLADSSQVYLNHHSKIEYPEQFASNERRIKLQGEAFFDIKPNPLKPFVIDVNQLQVRVLGTSFNIAEDSLNITVTVRTGKVEVTNNIQQKEILLPGQAVVYNKKGQKLQRQAAPNPNEYAYYNKVFTFNNTSLAQVARSLSKGYHACIRVDGEQLSRLAITTSFENENLPDALQIIAETLQLEIKHENETYVFVKK
jgi:transmembrane sensor